MSNAGLRRGLLLAVAGPAAAGAAVGFGGDLGQIGQFALQFPLLVLGVGVLTLPALFIARSLVNEAPPAGEFVGDAIGQLGAAGVMMLGFAPALLFFSATSGSLWPATWGLLALGVAGTIAAVRFTFESRRSVDGPFAWIFSAAWVGLTLSLGLTLGLRALFV